MENDLISRSALRLEVQAFVLPITANNLMGAADAYYRIMHLLDEQPAVDAVEVVRCKDCKHFTNGMAVGMCKRLEDKPIFPIPYNHFCSFGERRDCDAAD